MPGEEILVRSSSEERSSEVIRSTHEHESKSVAQVSFTNRQSSPSTLRLRTTISQPAATTIERSEFRFETKARIESPFGMESVDKDLPLFVRPLDSHRSDEIEISKKDESTAIVGRDLGHETVSYELLADFSSVDSEMGSVTVGYEIKLAERDRLHDTFVAIQRTTLAFE